MRAAVLCSLAAGTLLAAPAGGTPPSQAAASSGLPEDGPPALYAAEPELPAQAGWPAGEDFPRTSGSGRYADGAHFWTDWIHDDHGALGTGPGYLESPGAPSFGTYRYTGEPAAHNNGADVFRSAVALDGDDTVWRVDWNTLVDPGLPAAAWAVDTDADPSTGGRFWAAGTGLRADGIERVLVVTGQGAWLHDVSSSALPVPAPQPVPVTELGGSHAVDLAARSFVVRLPRAAFGAGDRATVRLAAGLADGDLPSFRQLTPLHGWAPGQPNVYNASYREAHVDEPDYQNTWMDTGQLQALTAGDVSAFAHTLDWPRLAAGETEPEPLVTGFVNRWYVSTQEPGQGSAGGVLGNPAYLGRVQPYMAYVPTTYAHGDPTPLTFVLHGASANHNSSPATSPKYLQQACEIRGSICVSPLGRGPLGVYTGLAELDVWEVWKALDDGFTLDPDGTVMSGTSMGGAGTYRLTTQHPHLFAAAGLITPSTSGIVPEQLANLRWTPYYHYHGNLDQLTPITGGLATIEQLRALGYRFTFDHYVAEDHVLNALKDGFSAPAEFFGDRQRVADPGRISYVWQPGDVDADLGLGPRGAWWVTDVLARDVTASTAAVEADSRARPFAVEPFGLVPTGYTETFRPAADPSPATRKEQRWLDAPSPTSEDLLLVQLRNVTAVTVDVDRAGLPSSRPSVVRLTADGDGLLRLTGLSTGTRVVVGDAPPRVATSGGVEVPVRLGTVEVVLLPRGSAAS